MLIGTRVLYPDEVGRHQAEIIQISVYRGMKNNLQMMKNCATECKNYQIPYVVHPVGYSLLQEETLDDIRLMAEWSGRALILHDERGPDGKRLSGNCQTMYEKAVEKVRTITPVSFENANDTGDVQWFWRSFADSITVDIGHIESAGLDSIKFVKSLDEAIVSKIHFVHMHRNNGLRGGITDHWPLHADCREMLALKELLQLKSDLSVILELNEVEEIDESIRLLKSLRNTSARNS